MGETGLAVHAEIAQRYDLLLNQWLGTISALEAFLQVYHGQNEAGRFWQFLAGGSIEAWRRLMAGRDTGAWIEQIARQAQSFAELVELRQENSTYVLVLSCQAFQQGRKMGLNEQISCRLCQSLLSVLGPAGGFSARVEHEADLCLMHLTVRG